MKVSSPIGELPFEPRRVTVSRAGIEIEGAMGAWPAHVHIDVADLPALAELLPLRAPAIFLASLLAVFAFRCRPHRTSTARRNRHV
jgi:hypothetical protein